MKSEIWISLPSKTCPGNNKVKTKMDTKYTNRIPQSRSLGSLRVLGVLESRESRESRSLKPYIVPLPNIWCLIWKYVNLNCNRNSVLVQTFLRHILSLFIRSALLYINSLSFHKKTVLFGKTFPNVGDWVADSKTGPKKTKSPRKLPFLTQISGKFSPKKRFLFWGLP